MIGIDAFGTFTDLGYADTATGAVVIHKVATTPADPSRGMLSGMEELSDLNDRDRCRRHVYRPRLRRHRDRCRGDPQGRHHARRPLARHAERDGGTFRSK